MRIFKKITFACACLGFVLLASVGHADPTLPQHTDPRWQDLASVKWSVDGGNTWGNNTLTVGQTVSFQFIMHKDYEGTHYADLLKAWIDWDNDGFEATESIIFETHVVWPSYHANQFPGVNVDEFYTYTTSSGITLTNAHLGDHWLLARVTCSESLLSGYYNPNWAYQWTAGLDYDAMFTPGRSLYQGEAELYKLTVNPVPEPTTMLLFGTGLVGLAAIGRRKEN
jgi:hypothetical protein